MGRMISCAIQEDIFDKINEICTKRNISKSEYVRELINRDLMETPKSKKHESNLLINLKLAFGVEDIEFVETSEEKEEDIEIPVKPKYHPSPNKVWKLSDSLLKKVTNYEERNYFLDYESGFIKFTSPHGRGAYSTLSLNELLILEEYAPVTYGEVSHVRKILGLKHNTSSIKPSIFLWQQGVFDEIITNFKTKVRQCEFGKNDNYLVIMGEKSDIPIHVVKDIVSRIQNKGFSELECFNTCKSYNGFNPIKIRIICENYNNPELLKLLKNDDTVFVENNPSKRRNMIRNGGL